METCNDLGTDGIHNVADESDGGCDGYGLIYESEIVADCVLARRLTSLVHTDNIVAALGKRQKESEEKCHKYQPVTDNNLCGKTACKYAQNKAYGNNANIYNRILLELGAIGKVEKVIAENNHTRMHKGITETKQEHNAKTEHKHHKNVCLKHRNRTTGNGAMALYAVAAVGINIYNVVVAIYRRGNATESKEGKERVYYIVNIGKAAAKEHRQKHKQVFYPLLRTDYLNETRHF